MAAGDLPVQGYIKLHRKFFEDDPFWNQDRERSRAEAWIDMIQMAAWKPHFAFVGNDRIELARGQFLASRRFLAQRWKWTEKQVRCLVEVLTKKGQLRAGQETRSGQVYMVVNYETYQGEGPGKGRVEFTEGPGKGRARAGQGPKEEEREEGEAREAVESRPPTSPPSVLPKKVEEVLLLAPDPSASGSAARPKSGPGELFELTPEATSPSDPVEFWFPLAGGEPPRNAPHGPWRTVADGSFEYGIRASDVAEMARLFPGVGEGGEAGVRLEIARCRAWNVDNPSRRKTYPKGKGSGVREHLKSWLADKHGKGGPGGNGNGSTNGSPGKYGKTDAIRLAERGAMGRSQALVDKAARFQEIAAEERRRQEEARARS